MIKFLEIVSYFKMWNPCIDDQCMVVITDYKLLMHMQTQAKLSKRQIQRLESLTYMPILNKWRPYNTSVVCIFLLQCYPTLP